MPYGGSQVASGLSSDEGRKLKHEVVDTENTEQAGRERNQLKGVVSGEGLLPTEVTVETGLVPSTSPSGLCLVSFTFEIV